MSFYVLTFIGVAVFPLILAAFGGHLAALALNDQPKKKAWAIVAVWALAIAGILVFGWSQLIAFRADNKRETDDQSFKTNVVGKLETIIHAPDQLRQTVGAESLKKDLTKSKAALIPSQHPASNPPTDSLDWNMSNADLRKQVDIATTRLNEKAGPYEVAKSRTITTIGPDPRAEDFRRYETDQEIEPLCARANFLRDMVFERMGMKPDNAKLFQKDNPMGILEEGARLRRDVMKLPL